jgi:hypothetical protein
VRTTSGARTNWRRHFGLGDACRVDEVTVRWQNGETRTLTGYPANARYPIYPLALLGDADGDGAVSFEDIRGIADKLGEVTPASAVYDMNGDGEIGPTDLKELITKAMRAEPSAGRAIAGR